MLKQSSTNNESRYNTIGELNSAIIDTLEEKGFSKEDLSQNRLGRAVLTHIVKSKQLPEANSAIVKEAVTNVLASL